MKKLLGLCLILFCSLSFANKRLASNVIMFQLQHENSGIHNVEYTEEEPYKATIYLDGILCRYLSNDKEQFEFTIGLVADRINHSFEMSEVIKKPERIDIDFVDNDTKKVIAVYNKETMKVDLLK